MTENDQNDPFLYSPEKRVARAFCDALDAYALSCDSVRTGERLLAAGTNERQDLLAESRRDVILTRAGLQAAAERLRTVLDELKI